MNRAAGVDLILINPGGRKAVYQSLGEKLAAVEPPVWAGLMAAFIRKHGFSVSLIDADALNLTAAETAARVQDMNPRLAAIIVYGHQPSASTQNMPAAGEIAAELKSKAPHIKILMAGGHVAALPERTLREEKADFVSGGEGLYTILDLLETLKSGGSRYDNIRDLWHRRDQEIIQSDRRAPLVAKLDEEMPEVTWDLLPMDKYRAHNWHCFGDLEREPYAAIYTTLGCPYHCSFCCIQSPFKSGEKLSGFKENVNSYRLWSPQSVISQIDKLVNHYGVRNIKIADEMFVLNPRHVSAICDAIIERGYHLNIWAYARVDTVKDNMLEKLKKAGINWLAFGIEAASQRVRDNVDKSFDQEQIFKTIEKVRAAGINVIGNYIFGLPEDDRSTMQATLDMAMELNCEFANFYCTMAYPGSALYDEAVKAGWALPQNWSGYSQHSADMLPLRTKYLPAEEVIRFRDHAFQTYFHNPPYLNMISRKFGPATVNHIRDMASHKLERRFAGTQPLYP